MQLEVQEHENNGRHLPEYAQPSTDTSKGNGQIDFDPTIFFHPELAYELDLETDVGRQTYLHRFVEVTMHNSNGELDLAHSMIDAMSPQELSDRFAHALELDDAPRPHNGTPFVSEKFARHLEIYTGDPNVPIQKKTPEDRILGGTFSVPQDNVAEVRAWVAETFGYHPHTSIPIAVFTYNERTGMGSIVRNSIKRGKGSPPVKKAS